MMENNGDDDRIDRLFEAARKVQPYNKKIEYGFETRLMAKIKAQHEKRKAFFSWAWRLMPAFVSAVLLLGIWTYMVEHKQLVDLSSIAGMNNEETMLVASLTGE
jgi:hypothetical protein